MKRKKVLISALSESSDHIDVQALLTQAEYQTTKAVKNLTLLSYLSDKQVAIYIKRFVRNKRR